MGMLVYKTELGLLGFGISPAYVDSLTNIHQMIHQDVISVMYGTKIGSMPFGAAVSYSNHKFDYENKNLSGYTPPGNRDFRNDYDQYLAIRSGASLSGLDIGAAITLVTNSKKTSYWASSNWSYDQIYMTNTWQLDVSGRMELIAGLTGSATLSWITAQDEAKYLDNGNDYINRWNNSMLTLSAVLGKDLRVVDALTVKMACGLEVGGTTNGVYRYIDNWDPSSSYYGNVFDGTGDRTQYGYWYIPLNVGVEAKLNETWTLNSGVGATLVGFNNTNSMYNSSAVMDKEKISNQFGSLSLDINPSLDYAIGLTGKIGDLTIDLELNPDIFLSGPYFISGDNFGDMNVSVALRYDWI
jgi:hypothetical protein